MKDWYANPEEIILQEESVAINKYKGRDTIIWPKGEQFGRKTILKTGKGHRYTVCMNKPKFGKEYNRQVSTEQKERLPKGLYEHCWAAKFQGNSKDYAGV